LIFLQGASAAAPSPGYQPIESDRFTAVAAPRAPVVPIVPVRPRVVEHDALLPEPPQSAPRKAQPPLPVPAPGHVLRTQPSERSSSGRSVTGIASWYCLAGQSICHRDYPDGAGADLYAAAGPALRTGNWRGRVVNVCASSCVRVKLVDWCACGGGRVIDLYADAFNRISSLSAGVVRVSVTQ
jgi:rare lipoprotein A (peptidoglycan hydrolase)